MTLEQKIGQLFFIGIAGADVDGATRDLLTEVSPGGICLFARNIRDGVQARALIDEICLTQRVIPFLSIDQEGGLVDRLRRILGPMPAASKISTPEQATRLAAIIAEALRTLGFNMNFAPVVDVIDANRAMYSNGLASRAFGTSPAEAVQLSGRFLDQLQKGGIIGCLKHFPGLAAARVDSHEELPDIDCGETEMNAIDLIPYRELIASHSVRAIMAAHAAFPGHRLQETDQNGRLLPSSLSYGFITSLLREELGFDGLVITDDLEMGAIVRNYGIAEASRLAVKAGVDMLAICADPALIRVGYAAVLKAVNDGEITIERVERSLNRIAAEKSRLSTPPEFDMDRLDRLKDEIAGLNSELSR